MNFTIQAPPMIPFIVLGAIDTTLKATSKTRMKRYNRGLTITVQCLVFVENLYGMMITAT